MIFARDVVDPALPVFKFEFFQDFSSEFVLKIWSSTAVSSPRSSLPFAWDLVDSFQEADCFVSVFKSNLGFEAAAASFLQNSPFLPSSFLPFFVFNLSSPLSSVSTLPSDLGSLFEISNVLKIKRKFPRFRNLKLLFDVSWKFRYIQFFEFSKQICSFSSSSFKKKLPSLGEFGKNIRVLRSQILDISRSWVPLASSVPAFAPKDSFLFDLLFEASADVFRNEKLELSLLKDSSLPSASLKFPIRLPDKVQFRPWFPSRSYVVGDVVFFGNKIFQCSLDHVSSDSFDYDRDRSFWVSINTDAFCSFRNSFSFFENQVGRRFLNNVFSSLDCLFLRHCAESVSISFVSNSFPALNDFFVLNGEKFRVSSIRFVFQNGSGIVFLQGVQFVQSFNAQNFSSLSKVYCKNYCDDYFSSLNWKHETPSEKIDVSCFDNSLNDLPTKEFSGLVIKTPQSFELSSSASLSFP